MAQNKVCTDLLGIQGWEVVTVKLKIRMRLSRQGESAERPASARSADSPCFLCTTTVPNAGCATSPCGVGATSFHLALIFSADPDAKRLDYEIDLRELVACLREAALFGHHMIGMFLPR